MFIGAINQHVRQFLGNVAEGFRDRAVIIGCSGNFSMETVLSASGVPCTLHANDVSLYSCLLGAWLTGAQLPVRLKDPTQDWLLPYLEPPGAAVATIMVLLDMVPFAAQRNAHTRRMWHLYQEAFGDLVRTTQEKLDAVTVRLTSFWAGDVLEHFAQHDTPDAVFCCFAPTYRGGYERLYKALDALIAWPAPTYPLLDDVRRQQLLAWMRQRQYLWYDDRLLPDEAPVMHQYRGRNRTVYLYSNVVRRRVVLTDQRARTLPRWPLVHAGTCLTPQTPLRLVPIKTTDLAAFKDAYLGKAIVHGLGQWAFAVVTGDEVAGFLEYKRRRYGPMDMALNADFALTGSRYPRLSKLMVMLACAGETRALLERLVQLRVTGLVTTAFTERAVSMKYRGVLTLVKRGRTPDGQAFLNYAGTFTAHSWQETLQQWLTRYPSPRS